MDRCVSRVKNNGNSSSCPESKMPLQHFFEDIHKRVTSKHANSENKQSRKVKDRKKELVVDPQNVVKTSRSKMKGMVVKLPREIDINCQDKENTKVAKRAYYEYTESCMQAAETKRQCKVATNDVTLKEKTGALADIQNVVQNARSWEKPNKKDTVAVKVDKQAIYKSSTENIKNETTVKKSKKSNVSSRLPIPIPKPLPKHLQGTTLQLSELSSAISSLINSPPDGVRDIDANCIDHLRVPEYGRDYIKYLQERESLFVVNLDFLRENEEMNYNMRSILVDWLIQVQNHLDLDQETLHVTVTLIDNFLEVQHLQLSHLQLLGITCLLVASKIVERFAPPIDKLIHLTDNTYEYNDVIVMEIKLLTVLNFGLHPPVCIDFLDRFLMCVPSHNKLRPLCQYILDLTLHDSKCISLLSSLKTTACITLARSIIMNTGCWGCDVEEEKEEEEEEENALTPELRFYSGYSWMDLHPCLIRFAKLLHRAETSNLQGAVEKYSSFSQYNAISKWPMLQNSQIVHELALKTSR